MNKHGIKRGVVTEVIEINRAVPVKVRIKTWGNMFDSEDNAKATLYNDSGKLFGWTAMYSSKRSLKRGLDRFFGKGNWVEVK